MFPITLRTFNGSIKHAFLINGLLGIIICACFIGEMYGSPTFQDIMVDLALILLCFGVQEKSKGVYELYMSKLIFPFLALIIVDAIFHLLLHV